MLCRLPRPIFASVSISPVFEENRWSMIVAACRSGNIPSTWAVGDSRPMSIGGIDYQIDIIGKNHDTYTGGGTAPLTFQMHDCYTELNQMNATDTNSGGWTNCAMRNTHLPAILALMPPEVQAGIRAVDKLTSAGEQSSNIVTTSDKLFLLSELEITGGATYSKFGEGSRYEYYTAGGSRVKNHNGEAYYWWARSPHGSNSTNFCDISRSGNADEGGASNAIGIALAFCF